jgi:hypothetical protein
VILPIDSKDSKMSHFPSTHLVTKFVSGQSEALTGQRLAKVKYKTTAKQAAKYPNVCVSVPFIASQVIEENISKLMPYIKGMLENAQDGVIRSLYESSDGTLTGVTDTDIGLDACLGYLEADAQGSRLTKELISAWFETSVKDYLFVIIAEKLKYSAEEGLTEEQEATIGRHLNGYRGLYESLAGGKTVLQENQIKSLNKVLELIDSDEIGQKLQGRLNAMLNKPKIEELLEL